MAVRSFPMIPAGNGPYWLAVVIFVVLAGSVTFAGMESLGQGNMAAALLLVVPVVVVPLVLLYVAHSSRHSAFLVGNGELKIKGFRGRSIALANLSIDDARGLDLKQEKEFAVKGNVQGTKMPWYKAGSCRLRNGEKAMVYLTDERRTQYIPTTNGYALLMSVNQPREMLKALKAAV